MICDPNADAAGERSDVVAHIVGSAMDALRGSGESLPEFVVEQLAQAVDQYLEREGPTEFTNVNYLVMLASRALASLGKGRAAGRLLIYGSGLAQPAEWDISGENAMWIVDLREACLRDENGLEMILFASLGMILDVLAEVWDTTAGRGILGLRHVCETAEALFGMRPDSPQARRVSTELVDFAGQRLEALGKQRKWRETPFVVNLDLLR